MRKFFTPNKLFVLFLFLTASLVVISVSPEISKADLHVPPTIDLSQPPLAPTDEIPQPTISLITPTPTTVPQVTPIPTAGDCEGGICGANEDDEHINTINERIDEFKTSLNGHENTSATPSPTSQSVKGETTQTSHDSLQWYPSNSPTISLAVSPAQQSSHSGTMHKKSLPYTSRSDFIKTFWQWIQKMFQIK